MGPTEALVLVGAALGLMCLFVFLGTTRPRVMQYHDLPTPRVNEMTHGGDGGL